MIERGWRAGLSFAIATILAPLVTTTLALAQTSLSPQPAASMPEEIRQEWMISINDKGQIYFLNSEVKLDDLVPKLQAIVTNDKRIYIRADRNFDLMTVARIMRRIGGAGYQHISLLYEIN